MLDLEFWINTSNHNILGYLKIKGMGIENVECAFLFLSELRTYAGSYISPSFKNFNELYWMLKSALNWGIRNFISIADL